MSEYGRHKRRPLCDCIGLSRRQVPTSGCSQCCVSLWNLCYLRGFGTNALGVVTWSLYWPSSLSFGRYDDSGKYIFDAWWRGHHISKNDRSTDQEIWRRGCCEAWGVRRICESDAPECCRKAQEITGAIAKQYPQENIHSAVVCGWFGYVAHDWPPYAVFKTMIHTVFVYIYIVLIDDDVDRYIAPSTIINPACCA